MAFLLESIRFLCLPASIICFALTIWANKEAKKTYKDIFEKNENGDDENK